MLNTRGLPIGWARSQLALQLTSLRNELSNPGNQTREYWSSQVMKIDQQYQKISDLLQAELFKLVHRRAVNPGEDISIKGGLGMCVPTFVYEIDKRIKDLRKDRDREKEALIEEATRAGALPGWFR